jgi:hypothetical protein
LFAIPWFNDAHPGERGDGLGSAMTVPFGPANEMKPCVPAVSRPKRQQRITKPITLAA